MKIIKNTDQINNQLSDAIYHFMKIERGVCENVKIAINKKAKMCFKHLIMQAFQVHPILNPCKSIVGGKFLGVEFVEGYEKEIVVFSTSMNNDEIEPIKISIYE